MFGIHTLRDSMLMQDAGRFHPPPGGGGAGAPNANDVPADVLQRFASQAKSMAELQQSIAQWLAQHGAIKDIYDAIPPNVRANGKQLDAYHWYDPTTHDVYLLSSQRFTDSSGNDAYRPTFTRMSEADAKDYLRQAGLPTAGTGQRLTTDDPRYWQLEYDKLNSQYMNMGLDAESARRQALATLIANRNNTALGVANTSADIAKQAALFAANPRDTYAEALYRNQVGGSTPFGDTNNTAFGEYGKALANKAASIFQPVSEDLNAARRYRDSIAPLDFLGSDTRSQLGLQPTAAQALTGASSSAPVAPDPWAPMRGYTPEQNAQFIKDFGQPQAPAAYARGTGRHQIRVSTGGIMGGGGFNGGFAEGGTVDVGNLTRFGSGHQPSSTEGGLNLNIHELAHIVGESGHVYASLGEGGYPEQVKITPTPSGKKAAQTAEKSGKALSGTLGGRGAATGATGTVDPSLDEMNKQYSMLLARLGGAGGGSDTPYGGARFLAGAPWAAIQKSPYLQGITDAGYSIRGIAPDELAAEVKAFTPATSQNNFPRVNFG